MKKTFHLIGRNTDTTLVVGNPLSLSRELMRSGEFHSLKDCSLDEVVVCVDVAKLGRLKGIAKAHPGRVILVRNEPEVVCPANFDSRVTRLFTRIIDVGRGPRAGSISLNWPQSYPEKKAPTDTKLRKPRAIVINAYKYSFIRGQLYGLRAAVCATNSHIDLFGHGWGASPLAKVVLLLKEVLLAIAALRRPHTSHLSYLLKNPLNYLGAVDNKLDKLAEYKVALVIENDPSFLSEKLFDSFFAGTIPVYVGDKPEEFGIPTQLYVQAGQTIDEVKSAIDVALGMNYQTWRATLDEWLYSESTRQAWASENVLARIAKLALS
jgi:hypothetical protein